MYTHSMEVLDQAGVRYELRPHSREVYTVEEAARERGVRVEQIVKVMLAKSSEDTLLAVLVPGHKRLDLKRLRRALGDRSIRLASPAEIEATLGVTVGAITPVDIHQRVAIHVDRGILDEEVVAISSGSPDAGLLLSSRDLLAVVGGRLGDYTRAE